MCARYHGKTGLCYIATNGTAAAASVVLSEWELNMARDFVEVTSFTDSNKTYVSGLPDISGRLSGYWDDTSDTLYDASGSADAVRMYLYPSSLVLTKYWCGTANLDFTINTPVGGPVAVSANFRGGGAWSQF